MLKLHLSSWQDTLPTLEDGSIDLVLTDPPFKKTALSWDTDVDWPRLWGELNRICKPDAAIIMFGSQPFTSLMIMSNYKNFKHEWIWQKDKGANFAQVKRSPMKEHENVAVFSTGRGPIKYFPQMQQRSGNGLNLIGTEYVGNSKPSSGDINGGRMKSVRKTIDELRYPSSIQKFNRETGFHPTQKPVDLGQYLIRTYSVEGDTVLDPFMGSGSFGVSAAKEKRNYIGIDSDETSYNAAKTRLDEY
jgi:site-specific DNA-methyltransferase (adenine-specific)